MTATEELRRMLDERGAEHCDFTEGTLWLKDGFGYRASADEGINGFIQLHLWCTTPRQAIEATLGCGTCHIVKTWSDSDYVDGWRYRCSECMCFIPVIERDPETGDVISAANFCPNCGRKVVIDG